MKADLEKETETPPETIPWQPGMCSTPECGRLVPDEATFCAPCSILFGSYTELIAHDDVEEWQPPEPPVVEKAPSPKRRPRRRPTVPPIEGVQPETS